MGRVEVECPACQRPRWVSPERATRIRRGVVPANCRSCKGKAEDALSAALPRADFTDGDLRWWMSTFGVDVPEDVRPAPWIRAHGLPPDLHELVASLRP